MTLSLFLWLLTIFSIITVIIVQAVKKTLDVIKVVYATNVVAGIAALVVGIGGTALVYLFYNIEFSATNTAIMVLVGIANWLGSMVGYDKVKQTISQIVRK